MKTTIIYDYIEAEYLVVAHVIDESGQHLKTCMGSCGPRAAGSFPHIAMEAATRAGREFIETDGGYEVGGVQHTERYLAEMNARGHHELIARSMAV